MAKKEYKLKMKSQVEVLQGTRNLAIKDMVATTGGVVRIFPDQKRQLKSDKVGRKSKYRKEFE